MEMTFVKTLQPQLFTEHLPFTLWLTAIFLLDLLEERYGQDWGNQIP